IVSQEDHEPQSSLVSYPLPTDAYYSHRYYYPPYMNLGPPSTEGFTSPPPPNHSRVSAGSQGDSLQSIKLSQVLQKNSFNDTSDSQDTISSRVSGAIVKSGNWTTSERNKLLAWLSASLPNY
ncbi:hypothetical protein RUND412_009987, partial [Rhizina undulata]